MHNTLYTLSKIFTERIFRIPDYQRGYAWKEKQLRDFWNDLEQLEDDKNHYTGVLTLEEIPYDVVKKWDDDQWIVKSKGFAPFYVVDGQQRLTTSIVLIQALIEWIKPGDSLNYTSGGEIQRKFIFDSKDNGNSRSYIFGYERDNPSYEFLKARIFLDPERTHTPLEETFYTANLEYAKQFFQDQLKTKTQPEIEKIYKKITQQFLFNVYAISDSVDVHVAFETMNNRGKALSHLELLKNRLIYLSSKLKADVFTRNSLRKAINETWKSVYHYLGKNKERPLQDDVFLQHHFELYFGEEIYKRQQGDSIEELRRLRTRRFMRNGYEDFLLDYIFTQKNLQSQSSRSDGRQIIISADYLSSYVKSLKTCVELWSYITDPMTSSFPDEEKNWLEKLDRQGSLNNVAALLLSVYQVEGSSKLRIKLLQAIERRFFLASLAPTVFASIAREQIPLIEYASQIMKDVAAVEKATKDLDHIVDLCRDRQEVRSNIVNEVRSRSFYEWRGMRYFLYEYEMSLQARSKTHRSKLQWDEFAGDMSEPIRLFERRDFYTVEHIYPQQPKKSCWTDAFAKYSERERKALRHSLGNLLPLSQAKNSSFQNICFADKKSGNGTMVGYKYGSFSEIEVCDYENWTAMEIMERGLGLLKYAEERWRLSFGDQQDKLRMLGLEFVPQKESNSEG